MYKLKLNLLKQVKRIGFFFLEKWYSEFDCGENVYDVKFKHSTNRNKTLMRTLE